jgi:hypothetical protein
MNTRLYPQVMYELTTDTAVVVLVVVMVVVVPL